MRNLLFGVLGSALFVTSCAVSSAGSSGRPNSAVSMTNGQQGQPKDPHDYVSDPTVGSRPPQSTEEKPLCHLQCSPHTRCDASGIIERCVDDETQKP